MTQPMEIEIIKDIADGKPVRIFLPLTDSKEKYRANCVFQEAEPPKFNLLFRPGTLPHDVIDSSEPCIISIDMGGTNISLEAMITEITNEQSLELVARKTINHDQMRDFFRVDATTRVISKSFHPTVYGKDSEKWSYSGTTIDISGSGLLASFTEEPPKDKQVRLELTLPNSDEGPITILASPIRVQKVSDNQYDIAYHFEDISLEDRDLIIGCCLIIQRQLLRLKVKVKGS